MGMAFQLCEKEDHKIVEDLRGNQLHFHHREHSNKTYYPERHIAPNLHWSKVLFTKFYCYCFTVATKVLFKASYLCAAKYGTSRSYECG
jgi:hypothetical protein